MDLHSQVSNNMNAIIRLFETQMDHFDEALEGAVERRNQTLELNELATNYNSFKDEVWSSLSLLKEQLELLSSINEWHEVQLRQKVLLFHGVPEDDDVIAANAVLNIMSEHLKLCDFDATVIDTCHRLGAKKDKPRPILVRFNTTKTRAIVWNAKKALKGTGVTLSEFLTKPRQEVFTEARKYFGVKQCWTMDSVIIVALPGKNLKKITSMSELETLISNYPPQEKPPRSRRHNKKNGQSSD